MSVVINSIRKALFPVLVFFNCEFCFAQFITEDTYLDTYAATYVMSVDEFMQRFNAEELHPDLDTTRNDNLRLRSILTLFDYQQFQVNDSIVAGRLIAFADTVCRKDVRLDLERGGVYAEACCSFLFNQKEVPINLVFAFEPIRDDVYRWALIGANGLKENKILESSHNGFINPTQHELRFSELSAASTELSRFLSVHKNVDQLSFLLGLLRSDELSFIVCNKVKFHFVLVPGYVFVVDEVNRLGNNSGYLINTLLETDSLGKLEYINQLLGCDVFLDL